MADSSPFSFGSSTEHNDWLNLVAEDILEPALPIIDAHHHLWVREPPPYLLREFVEDLATGHNVIATVFAECHSMYRREGPEAMRPVGESEFVSGIAAMSDSGTFGPTRICRAMVGNVDMKLGAAIEPVLDAHEVASGGRFRGVRVSCAWHESKDVHRVVEDPEYLALPEVREAIGVLARRGLSMDCWVYHPQLDELAEVARTFPDLSIVANHYGVPILGGPYRGRREEAFAEWRDGIRRLAREPNVVMKVGAMILGRRDRSDPELPPTSDDIGAAWGPWTEVVLEAFGADRCMLESNFPVHKRFCSYPVLWNAFKKMTRALSQTERAALFAGTANRVYRMHLDDALGG